MFDLMPERFEAECPPDFRESYIDVLKMVDEYWKGDFSRKDISVVQNLMASLDEARERFDHQYDLGRSMNALIDWRERPLMAPSPPSCVWPKTSLSPDSATKRPSAYCTPSETATMQLPLRL